MFKNLPIKTRVILIIGVLSSLLLAIGFVGLFGLAKTEAGMKTVYKEHTLTLAQVNEIRDLILSNRLVIYEAIIIPMPENLADAVTKVEANITRIGKLVEGFMTTSRCRKTLPMPSPRWRPTSRGSANSWKAS